MEKSDTGRNVAENAKEQTVRKRIFNNVVTPNRMANNIGMLAKAAVEETEDSMNWSQQLVTLQRKTPLSPMTHTPLSPMTAYAYPVYAKRFSQHWMLSALEKKGMRKIKLKVDTGAAGNTLPLRTYKQMYKTLPPKHILEPTSNVKLVAYNGQEIPCLGSINLQLRFGEKTFTKARFYVVDIPSAPIVGLLTYEKIGLVTSHCNDLRPKPDLTTVEGLKQAYPAYPPPHPHVSAPSISRKN